MLIPSLDSLKAAGYSSLSRRVNANSQQAMSNEIVKFKLIKKGEC